MRPSALLMTVVLAVAAQPTHAQLASPSASVTGGITQYDLAGTGTRNFVALRAQFPALGRLIIEPGVGFMRYRLHGLPQLERVSVWFPEVQLQAELPFAAVRPYLGVGGGLAMQRVAGESTTDATLSAAGGARIDVARGWAVGGELRIRAVDPFHGTTADWGLSLIRQF